MTVDVRLSGGGVPVTPGISGGVPVKPGVTGGVPVKPGITGGVPVAPPAGVSVVSGYGDRLVAVGLALGDG